MRPPALCLCFLFLGFILSAGSPFDLNADQYGLTATQEFARLNSCRIGSLLVSLVPRRRLSSIQSFTVLCILLAGDIELNPGPVLSNANFNICSLNIRSLVNQDHIVFVHDLASSHQINCFVLCETWISDITSPAELGSIPPPGFDLLSCPRDSRIPGAKGGGLGFLLKKPYTIVTMDSYKLSSCDAFSITLKLPSGNLTILGLYRPPAGTTYAQPFSVFMSEFENVAAKLSSLGHQFVIAGDFNIHWDNNNDSCKLQIASFLDATNLTQHVNFPTHDGGHVIDWCITHEQTTLSPQLSAYPVSVSDHFPIFIALDVSPPEPLPPEQISYRRICKIDLEQFMIDIGNSCLITHPPPDLPSLIDCYNNTLIAILDRHAPLIVASKKGSRNSWYTPLLHKLKVACRKAERLWNKSHSDVLLECFRAKLKAYHANIKTAKEQFFQSRLQSCSGNPRALWKTVKDLLHRNSPSVLPSSAPGTAADAFSTYFTDKIIRLRSVINGSNHVSPPHIATPPLNKFLTDFSPVSVEEVDKLLNSSPDKQCCLDPIPTHLLKKCSSVLLPTLTNIVNLSLSTGCFPDSFKKSLITPLIKKQGLDRESLSNYRPISNLSFLSKLTEKVIKSRLLVYLDANSLYNSSQSAYTKLRSTETVLLHLHDCLTRAIANQQITGLCLLDLSAAFDTIDHTILLDRLSSWFGIRDTALSWLRSYLCSRMCSVKIGDCISESIVLPHGVPQGSVLGPLLFILYTTPLSSLIDTLSMRHHLYADDTQLFISFLPRDFTDSIAIVQSALGSISSWMAANFLSLNASKTEFMLIGNRQQLAKLNQTGLTLPDGSLIESSKTARNLGIVFDNHLTFHEHITQLSKACFYHIRDLRRIRSSIDYSTACLIATSIVHSKLDYCNSLYLNLPDCELNRLQFVQNSLARAVCKTPRYAHVTPVLKSLHWLKVRQRITYKVASLTYGVVQTSQPPYLADLIVVRSGTSTRSSRFLTLARPPASRSRITNRSFYHEAPVIWNSLPPEMRIPAIDCSSHSSLSREQFQTRLKTYLFRLSFPDWVDHRQARPPPKPPR